MVPSENEFDTPALGDTILSGISRRKTNAIWCHLCVESKNKNEENKTKQNRLIRAEIKLMVARGEWCGRKVEKVKGNIVNNTVVTLHVVTGDY